MFRWKDVARTPNAPQDPILNEIVSAIDEATISEEPIADDGEVVFGDCEKDTGVIRLNMEAVRVAIGLHEMLHFIRPTWSEASVRARTTRILKALSDDQIAALNARLLDAMGQR